MNLENIRDDFQKNVEKIVSWRRVNLNVSYLNSNTVSTVCIPVVEKTKFKSCYKFWGNFQLIIDSKAIL